jgi:carboxylesterase type B
MGRLGVLGFLPPSSATSSADPNLGLLDAINGLKAVQTYVGNIGGDAGKVTIGGQSSGAGMIRCESEQNISPLLMTALLGAPTAIGLFRAAILQSDPMASWTHQSYRVQMLMKQNYGLASPDTTASLREAYYSSEPMSQCRSLACLQAVALDDLLDAQDDLLSYAPAAFAGVPFAEGEYFSQARAYPSPSPDPQYHHHSPRSDPLALYEPQCLVYSGGQDSSDDHHDQE